MQPWWFRRHTSLKFRFEIQWGEAQREKKGSDNLKDNIVFY